MTEANRGLGPAKWAVFLFAVFVVGQSSDCGSADPPPSFSKDPLALDCVVNGQQQFIPIEMSIDPDRYVNAGTGLNVDALITARVPYDTFCALADLGYVRADLEFASLTLDIAGASRPIPPEMTLIAGGFPLTGLDIDGACHGIYGPEVAIQFGPTHETPWSDDSWTMDFVLTVNGVDVTLTNVDQIGFATVPQMSLLDFCEPMDKSDPPNGTISDPEDSPRIAADPNRDGIYDGLATAENQVRLNVNGYCVGHPCNDENSCTVDHCDRNLRGWCTYDQLADGSACDVDGASGTCVAGTCVHDSLRQTKQISVGCTDNITADVSILSAALIVDPQSIVAGLTDDWELEGVAEFSEFLLDTAQGAVPGGVTQVDLIDAQWTVHMRAGASMADVVLTNPPIARTCRIGGAGCNPANDGASVPGSRPNTDCLPTGFFNPCQAKVTVPTSDDCAVGGVCDELGKLSSQCALNGFCVTGPLAIPLEAQQVSVTPDASGFALIGWDDQSTGATINPDGTYALPAAVFTGPATPMRMRIKAGSLDIVLECTMAVDSNGPNGVGISGQASPMPDTGLISVPIGDALPSSCDGVDCSDDNECTNDHCDPTTGACDHSALADGFACELGGLPAACEAGECVTARNWGTAELVETGDWDFAQFAHVGSDSDGNVTAVWEQYYGPRLSIWSNRYTPFLGWGTAVLIETDERGGASDSQVVVDPNGNATAVWSQHDGTRRYVWSNSYMQSEGWGTPVLVDDTGNAGGPRVAVDPNGNVTAVWKQSAGSREDLWSNRYTPSVGWGTAVLIEGDDTGHASSPQVAVDPNGNATAVWTQYYGTQYSIWSNRYTPSGGWETSVLIEANDAGNGYDPQLAVDVNGNVTAVWWQYDAPQSNNPGSDLWSNRYTPGAGWGTPELIETRSGGVYDPQVVVDSDSHVIAVWRQLDGPTYSIWSNRYSPGIGWGTPVLIEFDDAGEANAPQVAVDPNGYVTAVWRQDDGTRFNIWSNRYSPGIGWGTPVLIETDDDGDAGFPQMAVDPNGNVTAVWWQHDGTRYNIWSNRFE